jgi:hypothetical protein
MNALDRLKKFGRLISFDELEMHRGLPNVGFFLGSNYIETTLPIEEVERIVEDVLEALPNKVCFHPQQVKSFVRTPGTYSWKVRQEDHDAVDELHDDVVCTTAVYLYRKNAQSIIVELMRLNGNQNVFEQNWREILNAF